MTIRPKDSQFAFTTNPDRESVGLARASLRATGGYCPCKVLRNEDTCCICRNTRETGICECGLYVPVLRQD